MSWILQVNLQQTYRGKGGPKPFRSGEYPAEVVRWTRCAKVRGQLQRLRLQGWLIQHLSETLVSCTHSSQQRGLSILMLDTHRNRTEILDLTIASSVEYDEEHLSKPASFRKRQARSTPVGDELEHPVLMDEAGRQRAP